MPGSAHEHPEAPNGEHQLHYVLRVEITVKEGAQAWTDFTVASIKLLARMTAELPSWKLLGAYSAITGVPNKILHIWKLTDANALLEGMLWFGENNADYAKLSACCVEQRQELYTAMRYNPDFRNKV